MTNTVKFMDLISKKKEKKVTEKPIGEIIIIDPRELEWDDDWKLTPAEELTMRISIELAGIAAKEFIRMVKDMDTGSIRSILQRLGRSDYKTSVKMIQAMLHVRGYEYAADSLDLLMTFQSSEKLRFTLYFCRRIVTSDYSSSLKRLNK